MGFLRTIARNILSNAAGYLVNALVAFFLTPFVIHTLGKPVYGLWALIVACTGYYGLLDLGIRSAVGQYLTRYWSQGDRGGVNRTINTALGLTSALAVVLLVVTGLLALFAPVIFRLGPGQEASTRLVVLIMGGGLSLSFPLSVFGSATYARQRFDIANAIGIGERLLSAVLIVWVLTAGHQLVALAAVTMVASMAGWLARLVLAFRLLPGLAIGRRHFAWESVRELWSFGIYNFLINAADRIVLYTDAIVIGIILTKEAITHYSVGFDPINQYLAIINAIAWTLTPYATACDARGDRRALRRLWLGGTRNILLLAALVAGGLFFLGHDFLKLWVGEEFVSGKEYTSSATILAVLAAAALVRATMSCGKQVLFGTRQVKFLAHLSFAEALANLGLSLLLIRWLGILGVALGTLIPVLVTQLWLQPLFLGRRLRVRPRLFFGQVAPGGLLILATMGLLSWAAGALFIVDSWLLFLTKGILVALPAAILGLLVGTTRKEKQKVLAKLGLAGN